MSALWIRVEANAGDNDKVWSFADALEIDGVTAFGHLVRVWGALAQHRPDGRVGDVPPRLLARWAGWTGDPATFAAAFAALFVCGDVLCGWEERQGKLMERNERDAARKRAEREAAKRAAEGRGAATGADAPVDVRGQSADTPRIDRGESGATERDGTGRHEDQGPPPQPPVPSAPAAPPAGGESPGAALTLVRGSPGRGLAIVQAAGDMLADVAAGAARRASREADRRGRAAFVFAYWQARLRHPEARFDRKREARLVARLKENGDDVNELLYVVDGTLKDDHLMGRKPGQPVVYDGIQTIFRDREQVEKLARLGGFRGDDRPHPRLAELEAALAGEGEPSGGDDRAIA